MKIKVGVSARHVHLSDEIYYKLFDEPLENLHDIDQPGQFAAKQKVTIKTESDKIEGIRIVGPLREYNQIEISKTDAYKLKVDPPIKASGDLDNSLPITISGPKGEVYLNKGLIIADRHIHLTPLQVKEYGLENINEVAIRIHGEKAGILKKVHLKINEKSSLVLHLDTDDANAFNLKSDDIVEVLKIKS